MEPLLCWPDPVPPEIVRCLELASIPWGTATTDTDIAAATWAGAIVDASNDTDEAFTYARRLSATNLGVAPLLLLVRGSQLPDLDRHHDLFEDFCVAPFHPVEFEARVKHLLTRHGLLSDDSEIIQYKSLVLNLETYQASIDGTPLDLTYMEYELLKFLAQNPGRVFTRETLLSRVWGYEYYGGARTVDVHIRRLRAKLGEQHAQMIGTVRSVGYRFGKSRWDS